MQEMFYSDQPAWATPESVHWRQARPRYAFQAAPRRRRVSPEATNLGIGLVAGLGLLGLGALVPEQTRLLLLSVGLIGTGGAGLLWHAAAALRARRARGR